MHFLSIFLLEAPQCRERDRMFVERKRKEITSFELINYLQNIDIQESLGAMREQHSTREKLCIICFIVVRSLNDN